MEGVNMNIIKKVDFGIKKVTLIYMILYFIIAGMYVGVNGSRITIGEWDDYSYPTVSLIEGHRIGIKESDIPTLKKYYPEWADDIENIGITQLSGRYTRNGDILAIYFPTYALACIPMIKFLQFLGLPAVYAFSFTNFFAVMAVLLVIYKYLKVSDKTKLVLIVLLSINPIMFYFSWTSGEALIYSFLAIGLVCWYNRWYKSAAVFVSLAGTLNPTIMSVGIIMIAEYIIKIICKKEKEEPWPSFVKKNILGVIKYGSCYIIGLIPMIYFYYNTGYINLTVVYDASFLHSYETTWQRFIAYLFDLNFGILPYYSLILLIGFALLISAFIKRHWRYLEWFAAFIVNVFLYSIMTHINCGVSGISRYNSWGVLLLIFAVCLFLGELVSKTAIRNVLKGGIVVNAVLLAIIVYNYGPTYADRTLYIRWTPIAQYVLDRFPSVYNPLFSTFNSRTMHQDGGYVYETPIIYTAGDGYVRKVLASSSDAENLNAILVSIVDNEWLEAQIAKLEFEDSYLSFPKKYKVVKCMNYELGVPLIFMGAENPNVADYVLTGLSEYEDWGTWTSGNEFRMGFRTSSENDSLHGVIECYVFNSSQRYMIYVNDEKVSEGIALGDNIEFDFINPGKDKLIDIRIELPDANSPANLGISGDDRLLGLGLRQIVFMEE